MLDIHSVRLTFLHGQRYCIVRPATRPLSVRPFFLLVMCLSRGLLLLPRALPPPPPPPPSTTGGWRLPPPRLPFAPASSTLSSPNHRATRRRRCPRPCPAPAPSFHHRRREAPAASPHHPQPILAPRPCPP